MSDESLTTPQSGAYLLYMLHTQIISGPGLRGYEVVTDLQKALKKLSEKLIDDDLDPGSTAGEVDCGTAKAVARLSYYIKTFLPGKAPSELLLVLDNAKYMLCRPDQLMGWGLGSDPAAESIASNAGGIKAWVDKVATVVATGVGNILPGRGLLPKTVRDFHRDIVVARDPNVKNVGNMTAFEMRLSQRLLLEKTHAIAAQTKDGKWRVAVAVAKSKPMSGLGQPTVDSKTNTYEEIADDVVAQPRVANLVVLVLPEYEKLTRKWYQKPVMLVGVGAVALVLGGVGYYYFTRSKA